MTELLVNRQRVVLPEDMSITLNEDNPEITSNGDYTWDMTVSLLHPINAMIFGHLNRTNLSAVNLTMPAVLFVDNRIRKGSIVIQNNTDLLVNFQFLAGNSELNYIAQNTNKIWSLPWGTETPIDYARALATLSYSGYKNDWDEGLHRVVTNNFVCTPVLLGSDVWNNFSLANGSGTASDNGGIQNMFQINGIKNDTTVSIFYNVTTEVPLSSGYYTLTTAIAAVPTGVRAINFVLMFNSDADTQLSYYFTPTVITNWLTSTNWIVYTPKIIMQPYLLYYINKLPELLGYTMKYNCLNMDARAMKMFVVNAVNSLNYADALPDMTISDFITAIENFFNVSFILDSSDKSVSIVSLSINLATKKLIKPVVFDQFERDLSSNDTVSTRLDFTKISYGLGDSLYFKYQKIADDIIANCTIKNYDNYTDLINDILNDDYRDQFVIYHDNEKNDDYFFGNPTISMYLRYAGSYGAIKLVNKFSSVGEIVTTTNGDTTTSTSELIFKLIPSEMSKQSIPLSWTISGNTTNFNVYYQCPKSSNTYFIPAFHGFVETVESGNTDIQRISNLEVALYSGFINLYNENSFGIEVMTQYPFSHVDYYPDFGLDGNGGIGSPYADFEAWKNTYFMPAVSTTMRIKGDDGVLADYHQTAILDTTKEYTFTLKESPDVRAANLFSINNKTYMPVTFAHVVTVDGYASTVQGKFYALK